jgi:hypothetical protein
MRVEWELLAPKATQEKAADIQRCGGPFIYPLKIVVSGCAPLRCRSTLLDLIADRPAAVQLEVVDELGQ